MVRGTGQLSTVGTGALRQAVGDRAGRWIVI